MLELIGSACRCYRKRMLFCSSVCSHLVAQSLLVNGKTSVCLSELSREKKSSTLLLETGVSLNLGISGAL